MGDYQSPCRNYRYDNRSLGDWINRPSYFSIFQKNTAANHKKSADYLILFLRNNCY